MEEWLTEERWLFSLQSMGQMLSALTKGGSSKKFQGQEAEALGGTMMITTGVGITGGGVGAGAGIVTVDVNVTIAVAAGALVIVHVLIGVVEWSDAMMIHVGGVVLKVLLHLGVAQVHGEVCLQEGPHLL